MCLVPVGLGVFPVLLLQMVRLSRGLSNCQMQVTRIVNTWDDWPLLPKQDAGLGELVRLMQVTRAILSRCKRNKTDEFMSPQARPS